MHIRECRICGGVLHRLLTYENAPSCVQHLNDATVIDLAIAECEDCHTVQTMNEPPDYWFYGNRRSTGISSEMRQLKKDRLSMLHNNLGRNEMSVLEFGEPDENGVYVQIMRELGYGTVERTSNYIPYDVVQRDAIISMSYLEHVPTLLQFFKYAKKNLKPGGKLYIEVPNFEMMRDRNMFEEFMADHVFYFTPETIESLVSMHGFEIECVELDLDDYVICVTARKPSLRMNETRVKVMEHVRKRFIGELGKLCDNFNGKVAIYGASHQALMILSQLPAASSRVQYVIDDNAEKQGKLCPGVNIPIVPFSHYNDEPIYAIIVIAGGYTPWLVARANEKLPRHVAIYGLDRGDLRPYGRQVQ